MTIKINEIDVPVDDTKDLSYDEIVSLADTRWGVGHTHTVTFHHTVPIGEIRGERDGVLYRGEFIKPTPGMVVGATVARRG